MFFGGLNLIHILPQRKLDEGEGGRTERFLKCFATGESVKLNHGHSESLPIPRRCSFLVSTLHIAVVCRHAQASSTSYSQPDKLASS